jgi:hypothetical protein
MYRYERLSTVLLRSDFLDVVMPDSRYLVHQTHLTPFVPNAFFTHHGTRRPKIHGTWIVICQHQWCNVFLIAPNTVADSNKKIGQLTITPRTCRRFRPYELLVRTTKESTRFYFITYTQKIQSEERCGRCSSFLLRAPNLFRMFASTSSFEGMITPRSLLLV